MSLKKDLHLLCLCPKFWRKPVELEDMPNVIIILGEERILFAWYTYFSQDSLSVNNQHLNTCSADNEYIVIFNLITTLEIRQLSAVHSSQNLDFRFISLNLKWLSQLQVKAPKKKNIKVSVFFFVSLSICIIDKTIFFLEASKASSFCAIFHFCFTYIPLNFYERGVGFALRMGKTDILLEKKHDQNLSSDSKETNKWVWGWQPCVSITICCIKIFLRCEYW